MNPGGKFQLSMVVPTESSVAPVKRRPAPKNTPKVLRKFTAGQWKNDGWKRTHFCLVKPFFRGELAGNFPQFYHLVCAIGSISSHHYINPNSVDTHYKDSRLFRGGMTMPHGIFDHLFLDGGSYTAIPRVVSLTYGNRTIGLRIHQTRVPSIHPAASAGRCKKSLHPDPRPLKYPNASKLQPKRRESATSRSC